MIIKRLHTTLLFFLFILFSIGISRASDLSKAQKSYFKGEYLEAQQLFQKVVAKSPGNPMNNFLLGMTNFELKQYDKAKQNFEKTLEVKTDYELARLQLARTYFELGDFAWANVHLMHLNDIKSKEFEKFDLPMLQAVKEWQKNSASDVSMLEKTKSQLKQTKDVEPPQIKITAPLQTRGIKIISDSTGILVEGYVIDDSPIRWVKINEENIAIDGNGKFSKQLFLNIGSNSVRVVACDTFLNTAEIKFEALKKMSTPSALQKNQYLDTADLKHTAKTKMFGAVIGIGSYQDSKIPSLSYTVDDARAMYDVLSDPQHGFFKKENLKLLINEEATSKNIRQLIGKWLRDAAGKNDTVVIYFAGHGAPESGRTYWLSYDADIDNLFDTAIDNDSISEMLNSIKAKSVLCFLDSCYSAATVNRGWNTRSLIEKDPFKEFKGEGRVVVTSSSGKQESLESQEYGHGLFTYYLVNGLKGLADQDGDNFVVLDELWDYVKFQVRDAAKKFGHYQTPMIDGRHSAGIVLTKY